MEDQEREGVQEHGPESEPAPVVVDLGKVKRKHARALRAGEGPLMAEIEHVVDAVREGLADVAGDRAILPVVVLYRERRKKRKRRSLLDW